MGLTEEENHEASEVVSKVIRSLPWANPDRVYCAGFSSGGLFCYYLAQHHPTLVRGNPSFTPAITTVGSMTLPQSYRSKTPLLLVAGSEDEAYVQRGEQTLNYLAHLLGGDCQRIEQPGQFTCQTWGPHLQLYILPETPHQWPDPNRWPEIYGRMWEFLSQFSQ